VGVVDMIVDIIIVSFVFNFFWRKKPVAFDFLLKENNSDMTILRNSTYFQFQLFASSFVFLMIVVEIRGW